MMERKIVFILGQLVTSILCVICICNKSGNTIFIFLKSAISSQFAFLSRAPSVAVSIGFITSAAAANSRWRAALAGGRNDSAAYRFRNDIVMFC